MKIFIYSDLHICRTSSILPITNNKYSYRQQMIMNTGKWMSEIIDEEKPDLIINLGDTFDQHTITSYDVDTANEFFENFRTCNIPHLILVGNHDMLNQDFNSVKLLNRKHNITIINEPCTLDTDFIATLYKNNTEFEDIKLAFLPYCDYRDIISLPEGDILFSHMDIQGSCIRENILLEDGIDSDDLKQYKLVFNGHIHKPSINKNIINVGSITTHSFSDDSNFIPSCYIFDTTTMDLKAFKSKISPLFRKYNINSSLEEINNYITNLDSNYKYILQVSCPFNLKEEVKELLNNSDKIINSRITINKIADFKENVIQQDVHSNLDVKTTFNEFLNSISNEQILKYPVEEYINIIKE